MKIVIGFSPCPNDTFIFDALVNNKINTDGITFEARLEDVETLNRMAIEGTLPVSKVSYAVLPEVLEDYIVLNSGSALGSGVGPLLIGLRAIPGEQINNCIIAIPGEHTTAHMLFNLAFPGAKNKIFLRYNEIEDFVLSGSTVSQGSQKLGVIIHENRFTYESRGLKKIIDLGDFWQEKTGFPIPLGGIIGKRNIDPQLLKKVDGLINASINYAYNNYPELSDYVRNNSLEMEERIMRNHIDLYVNNYSLKLGMEGKMAVTEFLKIKQGSFTGQSAKPLFL
jgi:1,4-dihydroxy-6-naphthoate synthase